MVKRVRVNLLKLKAVAGDVEAAEAVLRDAKLKIPIVPPRKEGGRLLPNMLFLTPAFADVLSRIKIDFSKLGGISNINELREVLVEARRRLGESKVAVDDWLGKSFEVWGPRIPDVIVRERIVARAFIEVANGIVARNNALRDAAHAKGTHFDTGFTFMNAYYEMAGVTTPFTTVEHVHDVWIRLPGQEKGVEGPDRGLLIGNAAGQKIFLSVEFKTRGAKGGLRTQLATRDDRLFRNEVRTEKKPEEFEAFFSEHPKITPKGGQFRLPTEEGTKLAYTIEGGTAAETDFENIILLRLAEGPESKLTTDYLTKIGVTAGKRPSTKKALDAQGGEYVRITVPVETDEMRRVIEALLRDESWQETETTY